MARFYASIQGNRGEATRMGTPQSGMTGHIRGWNVGARVECEPDRERPDADRCYVSATRGSNGARGFLVATLREDPATADQGVSILLSNHPEVVRAARMLLAEVDAEHAA